MVMDESYVINQLKEDVSYVSTQFNIDMQIARYVYVFGDVTEWRSEISWDFLGLKVRPVRSCAVFYR